MEFFNVKIVYELVYKDEKIESTPRLRVGAQRIEYEAVAPMDKGIISDIFDNFVHSLGKMAYIVDNELMFRQMIDEVYAGMRSTVSNRYREVYHLTADKQSPFVSHIHISVKHV